MSNLYIRNKDIGRYTIFVHTPSELSDLISSYIPGRSILIGDLFVFNGVMRSQLLKFIEDNPTVDCYTSVDFPDPVLYSRFVEIYKETLNLAVDQKPEEFYNSPRSYTDAMMHLGAVSNSLKLLVPRISVNVTKLLV